MCALKETRTEGLILSKYHELVKRAQLWRGGEAIHGMTDEEYNKGLDMFDAESVIVPANICQNIVAKVSNSLSAARSWRRYFEVVLPFERAVESTEMQFDYRNPRLRDLPRLISWKLNAATATIFDDLVNPMLFEGASSASQLADLSTHAIAALAEEDPIMMGKASASLLEDMKAIFASIQAVVRMPIDSECLPSIMAFLAPPPDDMPSSAMQKARVAFDVSDWYSSRGQMYLKSLPTIVEKESDIAGHRQTIQDCKQSGDGYADIVWTPKLHSAVDCMGELLNKLPGDCISSYMVDLCELVKKHVEARLAVFDHDEPDVSELERLANLLVSSTIAWPLDNDFAEHASTVSDLRANLSKAAMQNKFSSELAKHIEDKELSDNIFSITPFASSVGGQSLPKTILAQVEDFLTKVIAYFVKAGVDNQEVRTNIISCMDTLLRFFGGSGKGWEVCFRIVTLMHEVFESKPGVEEPTETELAKYQKSVADLRELHHTPPLIEGVGSQEALDIMRILHRVYAENNEVCQRCLNQKIAAADAMLDQSLECLSSVAYGGTVAGTAWSSSLKPKSTLDDIKKVAISSGLVQLDIDDMRTKVDAAKSALTKYTAAHGAAGTQPDLEKTQRCESVILRAILTTIEFTLVGLARSPPADADTLRMQMQEQVLKLRAVGGKEKDLLPPALFKWMYAAMTSRA